MGLVHQSSRKALAHPHIHLLAGCNVGHHRIKVARFLQVAAVVLKKVLIVLNLLPIAVKPRGAVQFRQRKKTFRVRAERRENINRYFKNGKIDINYLLDDLGPDAYLEIIRLENDDNFFFDIKDYKYYAKTKIEEWDDSIWSFNITREKIRNSLS